MVHATSKAEIVRRIQQLVPPGSPDPQDSTVLATLQSLTADLIQAYVAEGLLQEDPFAEVWGRTIHLYESEVSNQLKGKVVLVTGGEGCVGGHLVKKLVELGVRRVVSVDKARCSDPSEIKPIVSQKALIALYAADIRNYDALKHIFDVEKPDVVFHLAAQRHPGLAEIQIRETVTTSILGTQNIIRLCERYEVQQCIFSSTGKASRYFTNDVYAASKKFSEWQFAQAAIEGNVTYGMVRFTHLLDNSLVCQQIDDKIQQGKIVNIHAPHRYVTAQNVSEALHLLLNALIVCKPGKLKFLTVRNLGLPTETLEIALYKIVQSGKEIPIYFQGLLPGYEEPFFSGQFDWSKPAEIHLLINALEEPFKTIDAFEDMIVTELALFSMRTLTEQLSILETLITDPNLPEVQIKQSLIAAEREIASSIFSRTSAEELLKILRWGVHPRKLKAEGISINAYKDIVELLVQGLYGRLNKEVFRNAKLTFDDFKNLVEIISNLSSIQQEVAYLWAVFRCIIEFDDPQSDYHSYRHPAWVLKPR